MQRLIIDTEGGADDAVAIIMALRRPDAAKFKKLLFDTLT